MPEFVACPACGCRVQMSESMLGKSVRCIGCDHRFTAAAPGAVETQRVEPLPPREPASTLDRGPDPRGRTGPPPLPPGFDDPLPSPRRAGGEAEDYPSRDGDLPCCPECGRRVPWESLRCGHCGAELEIDPGYQRLRRRDTGRVRRDCEPHRGPMLAGMGNLTLVAGGFTLCLAGVPLLLTLPLGVTTWVMAANDLEKMRTGEMEAQGRAQTEGARASAITGIILSLFFGVGWGLLALNRWLP